MTKELQEQLLEHADWLKNEYDFGYMNKQIHALRKAADRLDKLEKALNNIAGGRYSRELMSDAVLQAALASPEGRSAWKERCICELQAMARAALNPKAMT